MENERNECLICENPFDADLLLNSLLLLGNDRLSTDRWPYDISHSSQTSLRILLLLVQMSQSVKKSLGATWDAVALHRAERSCFSNMLWLCGGTWNWHWQETQDGEMVKILKRRKRVTKDRSVQCPKWQSCNGRQQEPQRTESKWSSGHFPVNVGWGAAVSVPASLPHVQAPGRQRALESRGLHVILQPQDKQKTPSFILPFSFALKQHSGRSRGHVEGSTSLTKADSQSLTFQLLHCRGGCY